jgi:serine/threonine protein kinase
VAGEIKKGQKVVPTSLEAEESKLEGDEKKEFVRFISRMLQWEPEKRPTARELAEDPWPKSVSADVE